MGVNVPPEFASYQAEYYSNYNYLAAEVEYAIAVSPIAVGGPDLGVNKRAAFPEVAPGGMVTFTIQYGNQGTATATNAVLTDTLPAGLTYVAAVPPPDVTGAILIWNLGDVPTGSNPSLIVLTVTVGSGIPLSTTLPNTATIAAANGDVNPGNNQSIGSIHVAGPNLWVEKNASAHDVLTGDAVTFTITYGNWNTVTGQNVRLTDTLPLGLAYLAASRPPITTTPLVVWELGVVGREPSTITLTASVGQDLPLSTTLTNTVTILAANGEANGQDNLDTSVIHVTGPDLRVQKVHPLLSCPTAGSVVTYTITYSNQNAVPALGVRLTDTLPSGLTYVAAHPAPDVTGSVLVWNLGNLPGNAAPTAIVLTATVDSNAPGGAILTNTVTILAANGEAHPQDNVDTSPVHLSPPSLWVSKFSSHDPWPYYKETGAGQTVTYYISYGNRGCGAGVNVAITDTLPAGVTYLAADPPPAQSAGGQVVWQPGNLPPTPSTQRITLTVSVDRSTPPSTTLTNKVTIRDLSGQSDAFTHTLHVSGPDLTVQKGTRGAAAALGTEVRYTICYANLGTRNITALGVRLTDTLPANTTYVSADPAPAITGTQLVWNLGDLPVDGWGYGDGAARDYCYYYEHTIYLTVAVGSNVAYSTTLTNTVTIAGTNGDESPANNTFIHTLHVRAADLWVSKRLDSLYEYGDWWYATYRIQMGNQGGARASNVVMTDTIPESAMPTSVYYSYLSFWTGTTWRYVQPTLNNGRLIWDVGNLDPGLWSSAYIYTRLPLTIPLSTILTNTVEVTSSPPDSPTTNNRQVITGTLPIKPPEIVWPIPGTDCNGNLTISGTAQSGVTVTIYISGSPPVDVYSTGTFKYSTVLPDGTYDITATAKYGGLLSRPTNPVRVIVDSTLLWDPKETLFITTGWYGDKIVKHITNNQGRADPTNWYVWVLPNRTYTVEVPVCCAAGTAQVTLTVGTQPIPLTDPDGDHTYTGVFTTTYSRADMKITVRCGDQVNDNPGVVLIDPDGYVFDVTTGFATTPAITGTIPGVTVTCWVSDTATGWGRWPAGSYPMDGVPQVNPQVTGESGYFAFFTPAGLYRLSVEDPQSRYQYYRSTNIEVISQVVHVNIPATPRQLASAVQMATMATFMPLATPARTVEIRPEGFVPDVATVYPNDIVQWVNADANALHTTSSYLNPETNTNAWDSGVLNPVESYHRQFKVPGTYTYTDRLTGNTGTIVVQECTAASGADFTYSPAAPKVRQTVYFSGTVSGGTPPISYTWAFGDGGVGSGQYVSHTYVVSGTRNVTMTASNACGFNNRVLPVAVEPLRVYLPLILRGY